MLAAVPFLPGVHPLMLFEAVRSVEALAAELTLKRANLGVEKLVGFEEPLHGEALPADVAGMWSLVCTLEQ